MAIITGNFDSAIITNINDIPSSDRMDISQAIIKDFDKDSDFLSKHNVEYGIDNGTKVPILSDSNNYGFLKQNVSGSACSPNACDIEPQVSFVEWQTRQHDCKLEICMSDVELNFRRFWNMECQDFEGTQSQAFMNWISNTIGRYTNNSQWRIAYFDYLSNTNTDFAGIDGFFARWLADAPIGDTNRVEIAENQLGTTALQLALSTDTAVDTFKAMYDIMTVQYSHFTDKSDLRIETTRTLAENYLNYLRLNREINCCYNLTNDGVTSSGYSLENLNYLGVKIVIVEEWDRIIRFNGGVVNPIVLDNPHRAVLTYGTNKLVGSCNASVIKDLDFYYHRDTKKLKFEVSTIMGVAVPIVDDFILAI